MRPRAVRGACLAISAALHVAGLAWLAVPARSTPPRPAPRVVVWVGTASAGVTTRDAARPPVTPAQAGAHARSERRPGNLLRRHKTAAHVDPDLRRGDEGLRAGPPTPTVTGVAFAPPTFPGAFSRRADPAPFDVAAAHAAWQARQQAAALAALAMSALQAQVQQWTPGPDAVPACALPGEEGDPPPACDGVPAQEWQRLVAAVQAFYRQAPQVRLQLAAGEGGYRLESAALTGP